MAQSGVHAIGAGQRVPRSIQRSTSAREKNQAAGLPAEVSEFFDKASKYSNMFAAGANLFGTVANQFGIFDSVKEKFDNLITLITKCGTALQGLIKADQAYKKKNLIAMVCAFLELPIAIFTNGYNLWLSRGLSQGGNQLDGVLARVKKYNPDGSPVIVNGKHEKYTNFNDVGWLEGAKITVRECLKLLKECVTNPADKSRLTPKLITLFSSFMMGGSILSFLGFDKLGAGLRDFGGGTVDIAFMTDRDDENPNQSTHLYTAGVKWVGAAIIDFLKRFYDGIIINPTQLSLFFDRWAAVDYIRDGTASTN